MKFHNNGNMYAYVYIQLTCYKYIRNMQTCKKESKESVTFQGKDQDGGKERERDYQDIYIKRLMNEVVSLSEFFATSLHVQSLDVAPSISDY